MELSSEAPDNDIVTINDGLSDVRSHSGDGEEVHDVSPVKEEGFGPLWVKTFLRKCPDCIGIPGLKYVIYPTFHRCRRYFWSLILIGAVTMVTIQVCNRVKYLISKPISANIDYEYHPEGLPFPKVVICNLNSYVKSKTESNPAINALVLAYETSLFYPDTEVNISAEYEEELRNMTATDALEIVAHDPEKTFLSITFANEKLSVDNVSKTYTNYGLCYRLNDGENGKDIWTSKQAGRRWGLDLMLNTEQDEYYYGLGTEYSAGFLIQLLDQNETTMISELGFAVQPGTKNFISIQTQERIDVSPPYGTCGEKKLKYYDDYTITKCFMECTSDFIMDTCGCRVPFMRGNLPVCDPITNLHCAMPLTDELKSALSGCECPTSCQSTLYTYSVSSAKFPSAFWAEELAQYLNEFHIISTSSNTTVNVTTSYLSDNIVSLSIFFSDVGIFKYEQQAGYDVFALLSDIGGSVGLYLGFSFLSVIEIMDLCGVTFSSVYQKKTKSKLATRH